MQVNHQTYDIPSQIGSLKIKPMSWNDFKGVSPQNTWFLAHIYWNINYQYTNYKQGQRPLVRCIVNVSPKSWVNSKEDVKLLEHQYGHYLIGCLCALQFQKRVNYESIKLSNFQQHCRKVLQQCIKQYCKRQKQYDCDTYHYLNQNQQKEWQRIIKKQFLQFQQFFKKNKPIQPVKEIIKKQNKSISVNKITKKIISKESNPSNKIQPKITNAISLGEKQGILKNQIQMYKDIQTSNKLPTISFKNQSAQTNKQLWQNKQKR